MWKLMPQVAGCFLLLCLAACSCGKSPPPTDGLPPLAPAEDFPNTDVLPHAAGPIVRGSNYLYCGTFQLAWNRLKDDVVAEPIRVAGAADVADRLNAARTSEADLVPESYYAAAGFVRDGIIETIQRSMAGRFPHAPTPKFSDTEPDHILAYAYLQANVTFEIPFFENDDPLAFKGSRKGAALVTSFGIRRNDEYAYDRLREQAEVLYCSYRDDERRTRNLSEFAVDPSKNTTPYQIVLAAISPGETLAATLADLEEKIAKWSPSESRRRLGPRDVLLIPNICLRTAHHYRELEGQDKQLLNAGFEGYWIEEALQVIDFRLDRGGAELASEAKVFCKPMARHFVFDRPFLLYMKKRDAERPLLVMWVGNAEFLSKL